MKLFKRKKGISSLITMLLLIGISVAAALVFWAWLNGYMTELFPEVPVLG